MYRVRHLLPLLAVLAGCPEPKPDQGGGPIGGAGSPGQGTPPGPGGQGLPPMPADGQPVDLPPGVAPPPPNGVPMLVVDEAKATQIGGKLTW